MFYNSSSPLLGGEGRFGSRNLAGTLGPSPIYGELGLLILIFLLPFILSDLTQRNFKIKIWNIVLAVFFSILTILMAASRSIIILAFVAILSYFLISNLIFVKAINRSILNLFIIGIIGLSFIIIAPKLNLNYVSERFEIVNPEDIDFETVLSGESINRSTAFKVGRTMIKRESWMIGYGWGTVKENRKAWFGDENFQRSDPHSIYYSLPMLFGWIGSVAFIMMFIIIIVGLFKLCFLKRKRLSEFVLPALGISLSLVFFLINEYKITALSSPHYFMIIWIWLGIGNSFLVKYK